MFTSYERRKLYRRQGKGKAAAAFRSGSGIEYTNRTDTTIPAPTGIQNGDFLLIIFIIGAAGGSPPVTPPAGFLEVLTAPYPLSVSNLAAFEVTTHLYWKTANNEPANYTLTHANANSGAYMIAASGAANATPNVTGDTGPAGGGTNATAPSITTTVNNSLVVFFAVSFNFLGAVTPPGSPPTFVERFDTATSILYVATGDMITPGATGAKTVTVTQDPWIAGLIAIRP